MCVFLGCERGRDFFKDDCYELYLFNKFLVRVVKLGGFDGIRKKWVLFLKRFSLILKMVKGRESKGKIVDIEFVSFRCIM